MSKEANEQVFRFVLSWIVLFIILMLINKTRIGHVTIYYSLLLIILLILVTEFSTLAPIMANVETVGQINAKVGKNGKDN